MAVILATALTATAQTAPKRHGWNEKYPLYGDVDSLTITTLYFPPRPPEEMVFNRDGEPRTFRFNQRGDVAMIFTSGTPTSSFEYNHRGDITRHCYEIDMGMGGPGIYLTKVCTYKYNSRGKLIEVFSDATWNYDYETHDTYTYNSKGQLIRSVYSSWGHDIGEIDTLHYKYNSQGELIETYGSHYPECGDFYRSITKYDSAGRVSEEIAYEYDDWNGTLLRNINYHTYQYDTTGRLISETTTNYPYVDSLGTISKRPVKGDRSEYKYDANGNITERAHYNADGTLMEYCSRHDEAPKTTYEYDTRGNKTKECVYSSDGSLQTKTTYEYDQNNRVVIMSHYDGNHFERRELYEYDDKGNITTITKQKGERLIPVEQKVYKITYRK